MYALKEREFVRRLRYNFGMPEEDFLYDFLYDFVSNRQKAKISRDD